MEKIYKILKLAIFILAFAVVLTAAGVLYGRLGRTVEQPAPVASTGPATETRPQAPDFTFYDREGNPLALSDFQGKPVILNFWASWCGPCKSEMPDFQAAYEQYGEEIQFLLVDLTGGRETAEAASGYVEAQGYTFPIYFDLDSAGAAAYGVNAIPATYFLDGEGKLVTYSRTMLTESTLQKGIDQLLGE